MGAEGDQLVLDYLSRVGDLAQRALPAARRAELVARLREDIDRERGRSDSSTAVRRILKRLGTPDEVVRDAAALPGRRRPEPEPGPEPRPAAQPDWWRLAEGRQPSLRPAVPGDELAGLPGMTGGVTIPMTPPEPEPEPDPDEEAEPQPEQAEAPPRKRSWRPSALLETVAALLLLAGAVLGSWIALLAGWAIAYSSRRLSRRAARFAALGVPGTVAAGALVWLWGRLDGRWGEPIPQGQMRDAIGDVLPVALRIAAVASALFLLWRGRRAARPRR
ncbi:HAAS signaling domain-containing protein [Streptomyces sp. NPDC088733]|uniref:HAAS signaling domain-containing protein n=1 Tax=Streptomyces sp. NPDC088733 TaxID=3365880 RepID=UPI00381AD87F